MKMSRVFLVLGFVLIMALYSDAQPFALPSEDCCFNFYTGKIPAKNILNVKKTGSHCPQQGFVVTTVKHTGMCVREISLK
ncbi:C-C motif chemokine 13-like [Hemibagrus wyckioides]|uniref:C-C motif chemokine 13-like n=1 Tax=Hemibagrus wyckioides TaxID=337641 RepID=UPI00266BCD56|nr:C-C motif chemokine 13-like [Hemibagrus wyckioides]